MMHELALWLGYLIAGLSIIAFAAVLLIVLIEDRIDQWPD
jgi:hypothetical protein